MTEDKEWAFQQLFLLCRSLHKVSQHVLAASHLLHGPTSECGHSSCGRSPRTQIWLCRSGLVGQNRASLHNTAGVCGPSGSLAQEFPIIFVRLDCLSCSPSQRSTQCWDCARRTEIGDNRASSGEETGSEQAASRQQREVGMVMEVNSWLEVSARKIGRRKRPYSGQSKGKDWVKLESSSGLVPSSVRTVTCSP